MIGVNTNLRAGSPLHNEIITEICKRQKHSENKMGLRYQNWRDMDDTQVQFIKKKEVDRIREQAKRNDGVVDYVSVEVPYSYGMMMSAHTYYSSVFLNRDPIFQVTARHGEPQQSVLAMEALLGYQSSVGRINSNLYIWLYDACKYGVGIVGRYWDEEQKIISEITEEDELFLGQPTGKKRKVRRTRQLRGYEGNRLFNIRPYKFFHDPRVTYARLQHGEYCGYETELGWHDIVLGANQGRYFNIEHLKEQQHANQSLRGEQGAESQEWPHPTDNIEGPSSSKDRGFVTIWQFYIRIIPKEWKLGSSELPEIWAFTLANQRTIIEARPLGEISNEFPFYTVENEIEGYALFKRGVMETAKPMNDIMTWLFNSHFYNVRAALNNQFIYDPSKLSMKDILDPSPGKRIRMKPDAYGQDVRTMFQQIPVADVTRSHISDFSNVGELAQRALGITDGVMGQLSEGGRKTATEVRQASAFGINRLKTVAEYMSANGFGPLAQALIQATQQHYSNDRKFRIVGDIQVSEPFVNVTPEALAGFYDFVPVDGTLPIDRFAQANLWKEMLQAVSTMPQIAQAYDLAGVFNWIAQLSGLRNISQFRVNVAPPGSLEGSGGGDSVPLQVGLAAANLNEPQQIPNLGSTG